MSPSDQKTPVDRVAFITGATGFIGRHLLRRLARRGRRVILLCRESSRRGLRKHTEALWTELAPSSPPPRLVTGDLGQPRLGLVAHDLGRLKEEVEEIYHLAGLEDVQAPLWAAMSANVDGTRHLLDVAEELPRLRRVHYLSTIAVAGDFRGRFYEDDLDVGQRLDTAYAETKYQAEALARARREDLPIDIYRPAAVLGDSQSGEADRIEGPSVFFGLIPWLRRLPSWMPLFGPGFQRTYVHAAPVDFVVDALLHIAAREAPSGQTYCLTDPQPLVLPEFIKTVVDLAGGPRMRGSLPLEPLLRALRLPGLSGVTSGVTRLLGVPSDLLTYTGYASTHDTSHVDAALYGSGLACPPLRSYLPVLLEYYERQLSTRPLVRRDFGRPPPRPR